MADSFDIRFLVVTLDEKARRGFPLWQTSRRFQNANLSFSDALIDYVHQV